MIQLGAEKLLGPQAICFIVVSLRTVVPLSRHLGEQSREPKKLYPSLPQGVKSTRLSSLLPAYLPQHEQSLTVMSGEKGPALTCNIVPWLALLQCLI